MKINKLVVLAISIAFCNVTFATDRIKTNQNELNNASLKNQKTALCSESGQQTPLIFADYSFAGRMFQVTLKEINLEGSVLSQVDLVGNPPDLDVVNATTDKGDELVLIHSIQASATGLERRVLVCLAI